MRRSKTTVCIILFDSSGRILMQHRDDKPDIDYPGLWTVSGGGVDEGESIEEAAKRELEEETACRVDDLTFLCVDEHLLPSGVVAHRNFFIGHYDGTQELTCGEGQTLRFVSPEELSELPLVPDLEGVIRRAVRLREGDLNGSIG